MSLLFKDILRFISFKLVDFFVSKGPRKEKTIVILKLDVIGDYILFRNFIEELKKSDKYKDYSITLIGNSSYRDLALGLDSHFIDHYIFINFKKMTRDLWYRYRTFSEISKKGYEVVINPTYSREFNVTDSLVNVLSAKDKIGSVGTLGNIPQWQKKVSDRYYTQLIPAVDGIKFEFLRNKDFIESLLNKKIEIKKTSCLIEEVDFKLSKNYVVIFPGASTPARKWSAQNFAEVATHIIKFYCSDVIVLGGPADLEDANDIERRVHSSKILNLVGKTSLMETVHIIKKANLLISNETSGPHMAVMTGTPVIVLFNGNNFKRFIPYPSGMADNYFPVYHPEIQKNLYAYEQLSNIPGYLSELDMNEIKVEKVIELIDQQKDLLVSHLRR